MGFKDALFDFFFEKDDDSPKTFKVDKTEPTRIEQQLSLDTNLSKNQNTKEEKPEEKKPQNIPIPNKSPLPSKRGFFSQEYRRTCRQCGTTWHSLRSRETDLKLGVAQGYLGACSGASQQCSTCGMCGGTRQATHTRNADANTTELDRLRSCPKCGSHSYTEELL